MFEYNLSLILGHSVLYESHKVYSPNGIVDDCINGDPSAANVGDSTADQLAAYTNALPGLLNVTANQTLPVGQTTQNAANVLSPQAQALQTQMATQDLPGLTQLGNQLNSIQNQGGITNASQALSGSGGQLAQQEAALQQQLDPQYYATRNAQGGAIGNLLTQLGGANSVGLNGSDVANINRGLAQQDAQKGLLNAPSQTAAVSNALQFGNQGSALQAQKTNTLSQALNAATAFLPSSQGQVNAGSVGTGASTNQSTSAGQSNFLGSNNGQTGPAQSTDSSLGNSLLGGINNTATNNANINANKRSGLDVGLGAASSISSDGGNAGCCFIFLEVYNGSLPWYVRVERDKYYKSTPSVAEGYKRMAKWLVPLMRQYRAVSKIVNYCMVKPLTYVGAYDNKVNSFGWLFKPFKFFWFTLWKLNSL